MKVFTKAIIFAILVFGFAAGNFYFQNQNNPKQNLEKIAYKDDGSAPMTSLNVQRSISQLDNPPPPNTVPGLENFQDYATNGNSLRQLISNGDTLILVATYCDSVDATDANNGTSLRIRYNYSLNGGQTWQSTTGVDITGDRKSRYPDCAIVTTASSRTLLSSGRYWETTASNSPRIRAVTYDLILGVGSGVTHPFTGTAGTDVFSCIRNDGKIGCVVQRPSSTTNATDTLYYTTYDPIAGTYTPLNAFFTLNLDNTVQAYTIAASKISPHMTIASVYVNEPNTVGASPRRTVRVFQSSNGGTNWTTPYKILEDGFIAGDSVQAYWHDNVNYKPGTNDAYIVTSTFDYTTTYVTMEDQRRPWKIVLQSPALNSGAPVVVADWHGIPYLADTNNVAKCLRVRTFGNPSAARYKFGINHALLSHPALGFSNDGNIMYCAFSCATPDTSAEGFNYHDIFITYSSNGGMNWSQPMNVTNSPTQDETYPVVSPYGNNNGVCHVAYASTSEPGCHAFTDLAPVSKVYYCEQNVNLIGIINISSEIPNAFSLQQNYPNPFNPSTKIRFDISKASNITLKVYDISGKEVASIINNEYVAPGTKEVEFDGSNLASGVYFYKMFAGSFTDTKKMILVK